MPQDTASDAIAMECIRVQGTVQGVGFRPTVYRLARDCGLRGDVRNDAAGVSIRVAGSQARIDRFVSRLQTDLPPLAVLENLLREPLDGELGEDFRIVASGGGDVHTGVTADAAACSQCLAEVTEQSNRRAGYPFTNCTHCGPRLSILRAIPYDRENTSMRRFAMCAACQQEYDNPADRRFHAQPNACPDCGPRAWIEKSGESVDKLPADDWLAKAVSLLRGGRILAIKGIGGFHIACDATNNLAVQRLRQRKHRDAKPFAVMMRDLGMLRDYCAPDATACELLRSPAAPIVILQKQGPSQLAADIAPRQDSYGCLLPYTPLHHLIMQQLDTPIVLTSGNVSDEPQCIANDDARRRLAPIADYLLLNDRDIVNRLDDSVVRVIAGKPQLLRRARGYAPGRITLPAGFADSDCVLATGGELKNTFCLLQDGHAIISPHLGDLDNPAAFAAACDSITLFESLYQARPTVLAADRHPEYLSSKYARERAGNDKLPLLEVQHHHAHIAACLADNNVGLQEPPVLGIALDGLGFGIDRTLWGGEFLLADYRQATRLACFEPVPMPGGSKAITEPWRMAFAFIRHYPGWEEIARRYAGLPFFRYLADKPLAALDTATRRGINAPLTSACGRLFDAVAAVTGICYEAHYEAQGASELEALQSDLPESVLAACARTPYEFSIVQRDTLTWLSSEPLWRPLLDDLARGVSAAEISARFHYGIAAAITQTVESLAGPTRHIWQGRIALSGGVFQNHRLAASLLSDLTARGYEVYTHDKVPANDGGLSLGQALVAAAAHLSATKGQK